MLRTTRDQRYEVNAGFRSLNITISTAIGVGELARQSDEWSFVKKHWSKIVVCRNCNIPARYGTGYLGDIGVPPVAGPMDFNAWFEAYLGGQWYAFDARNNMPRIGRVLMARGRDAADVAVTTTFGENQLQVFKVWTEEVRA